MRPSTWSGPPERPGMEPLGFTQLWLSNGAAVLAVVAWGLVFAGLFFGWWGT